MADKDQSANPSKGSVWHRWEPHIHAPGTILNNQYGTATIEDFASLVEKSYPTVKALGITDYYSLETYEKIIMLKRNGRLTDVDFVFPNVEIRFDTGTSAGSAINGHLLISPEDSNHIPEVRRFLTNLSFSDGVETYRCTKEDLIKLGKSHNPGVVDEKKALADGTNQFKVTHAQLIAAFKNSEWAQKNILFAVAVNSNDGTSGLQKDHAFATLRRAIERSADIMMSSNEKQKLYWIGKGVKSPKEIIEEYKSLKPCIHGSDAHSLDKVGKPDLNRYTWIKGDLTFDSLKQICVEVEERVHIGLTPPYINIPANIIDCLELSNAPWFTPSKIPLNSGLIAIIGARGSGKTALADLISLGAYGLSNQLTSTSFIKRAYNYLIDVVCYLKWQTEETTSNTVQHIHSEDLFDVPKVQYLSQQFVDTLCSSEGITDELMTEIERVIFQSHPYETRIGFDCFKEFLDSKSENIRRERVSYQQQIEEISDTINTEIGKKHNLPTLKRKEEDKINSIETDKRTAKSLIIKGADEKVRLLNEVSEALGKISLTLNKAQRKCQTLRSLHQSVVNDRNVSFSNYLNKLKSAYAETALTENQWKNFEIKFSGDVETLLQEEIKKTELEYLKILGTEITDANYKSTQRFISEGVALTEHSYHQLNHESQRLKNLIGVDNEKGKLYTKLTEKIIKEEGELLRIKKEIEDAKNASVRINELHEQRKVIYRDIFQSIIDEENILTELYKPLEQNLKNQTGTLGKLSFSIHRNVEVGNWANEGEQLLDLRKSGDLRGKGSLLAKVVEKLKEVWETGTAEEVASKLTEFRNEQEKNLLAHCPYERSDLPNFNSWTKRIAQWLYDTNHVTLSYHIQYDGIDIGQLSPGTRGIVLLLLYLAVDKEDQRPLIIDQPEENLDPKSIFDELVPLFRSVKTRRQVIIVTHNANLVVNTDADQVIVAECGTHKQHGLPQITYITGGLENPQIRSKVCAILEGGERAFKERAKRLRLSLF